MNEKILDFTHPALNEPVSAIGGQYVFTRQQRIGVNGGEVLCYSGYFVLDQSCCGAGGCAYALVAGFVEDWNYAAAADGRPVSRVRPVADKIMQKRIEALIRKTDPYIQVSFIQA